VLCRTANLPLDAVKRMPLREFLRWLPEIERVRDVEFNALASRVLAVINRADR
jgi:hypothetical protein